MASVAGAQGGPAEVFVISDGTGETCAAAVRAAMLQFDDSWRLRIFGGIRHESELRRLIEQAAEARALVVFSLVEGKIVASLQHEAERLGVVTVDLLGPLIAKVAVALRSEPRHQPGLMHGYTDDYFKRVEAVEFAVRHDDGSNLHTLVDADIVVTGVSRTSKTPLSMYLAQRGYKTGNVPLVPDMAPPQELLDLDPRKVFGLYLDPATLLTIRQARLNTLGTPALGYADAARIGLELRQARRFFRARGWRSIDVSGRAVEESASRILELYNQDLPG